MAGALWPDRGEERAHANLRSALWRARREGPDLIASQDAALALVGDPAVDVRSVVEEARRLFTEPLVDTVIDPGLFTHELLPDWFEDWVLIERERIRQIALHALDRLAAVLLSRREYAPAVDVALRAVRAEPLRESARRVLLQIHLAEGNRSEAIREYDRYCALLWEELEVEPSAALRALVTAAEPRFVTRQ